MRTRTWSKDYAHKNAPNAAKSATALGRLDSHLQRHKPERPHRCNECPGKSKSPWELDQHMMVHTDERPHECRVPKCDAKFKTPKELAAHAAYHAKYAIAERKTRKELAKSFRGFVDVDPRWTRLGGKIYQKAQCFACFDVGH
jgi:hypothetical protein